MSELEISIVNFTSDTESDFRKILGPLEAKMHMHINCTFFDWSHAWAEIMKTVLYKRGLMLSQVGTSWMGSLESTAALRKISNNELARIGNASTFHKTAWQTVVAESENAVLAIPWYLDVYMLYYHKSLLKAAGVDEATAFISLDAFTETIEKLRAAGNEIPIAMPTQVSSLTSLHNLAGWVWSYGGDFISADGRKLLLSDPKTRQGFKAYFSLYKYMSKKAQTLSYGDCYDAFISRQAPITLRSGYFFQDIKKQAGFKEIRDDIGVMPIPEISYLGGSNLVIWKHIPPEMERYAFALLEHLSSFETQYACNIQHGILSARLDTLEMVRKETEFAPLVMAALAGRAFPKFRLWGLVEDKLRLATSQIWQALYSQENPDVEIEIAKVLDPLEHRLQITIDQ